MAGLDNPLKRAFYEQEAIRGCWTSRELDRQVSSQYYERMGLSKDKEALQKLAVKNAQQLVPRDILHNPVTLEFLGLESQDVYTETKLESYILNHLQTFLLEMGRGFCFEARQKRILIDQDYFKADLIFYHRILKCHVIIDLHAQGDRNLVHKIIDELEHQINKPDAGFQTTQECSKALNTIPVSCAKCGRTILFGDANTLYNYKTEKHSDVVSRGLVGGSTFRRRTSMTYISGRDYMCDECFAEYKKYKEEKEKRGIKSFFKKLFS